jgi:hypothetical protein
MKTVDDIASDINEYVNLSSTLEMTCKYLKIDLIASPLYNFRDALSHYILLYEADKQGNEEDKIGQIASIQEHLFRGLKDGYILIVNKMKYRVLKAIEDAETKTDDEKRDYRKLLHSYKKLEIGIRKNSESSIIRNLTPFFTSLDTLISSTKKTFKKHHIRFIENENVKYLDGLH